MRACLHDPEHGYYRSRPAIGATGDFVTAPEISQVFGELIGLWCVVVWRQMGAPAVLHLVELGPGRGGLLCDALRAARLVPAFLGAARVHLVETNCALRAVQAKTLAHAAPVWHDTLETVPPGPAIILGNEFLDTLEVEQIVVRGDRLRRRGVGVDAHGRLTFVDLPGDVHEAVPWAADRPEGSRAPPTCGDLIEVQRFDWLAGLAARLARDATATLLLDYGHSGFMPGDTLQAVRGHRIEHPLTSPGEADLSVQVQFWRLRAAAEGLAGAAVDGPVTQARFLGRLGIAERASRLMAANPDRAGEIEAGVARLMAPAGMGSRFKAIGIRSASLPPLPGLEPCGDVS
jgi:SAM-dependent MidA family methyltransferase